MYKKKIDGKVVGIFGYGNTFIHANGQEESFAEGRIEYDNNELVKIFVRNDGMKTITINKKLLEQYGFEIKNN